MDEITILQADVLRTLASPRRLEILHLLAARAHARSAAWPTSWAMSQPNVSQHLAVLRAAGLVEADRDGREVRYRLDRPGRHGRLRHHARRPRAPPPPPGRPRSSTSPVGRTAAVLDDRLAHEVNPMDEPLNLVLFSGTDDKLQAAAVLTAGAAALGKPVNIFLQYWALDAFRADRDRPGPRPGPRGRSGGPRGRRCARAGRARRRGPRRCARPRTSAASTSRPASLSMDLLHLESADLDPLVDGVEGVTAFYLNAGDGQVVFI